MAKFIIDTTDNNISRSMLEMILEEHLDYNVYVKEVKPIDEDKLDEIVECLLDDAYCDEDMELERKAAIYGCKLGYKKAKSE